MKMVRSLVIFLQANNLLKEIQANTENVDTAATEQPSAAGIMFQTQQEKDQISS